MFSIDGFRKRTYCALFRWRKVTKAFRMFANLNKKVRTNTSSVSPLLKLKMEVAVSSVIRHWIFVYSSRGQSLVPQCPSCRFSTQKEHRFHCSVWCHGTLLVLTSSRQSQIKVSYATQTVQTQNLYTTFSNERSTQRKQSFSNFIASFFLSVIHALQTVPPLSQPSSPYLLPLNLTFSHSHFFSLSLLLFPPPLPPPAQPNTFIFFASIESSSFHSNHFRHRPTFPTKSYLVSSGNRRDISLFVHILLSFHQTVTCRPTNRVSPISPFTAQYFCSSTFLVPCDCLHTTDLRQDIFHYFFTPLRYGRWTAAGLSSRWSRVVSTEDSIFILKFFRFQLPFLWQHLVYSQVGAILKTYTTTARTILFRI